MFKPKQITLTVRDLVVGKKYKGWWGGHCVIVDKRDTIWCDGRLILILIRCSRKKIDCEAELRESLDKISLVEV